MGKSFGNLYYVRNIIYYKISSYEQRAFANFWRESFRNIFNEIREHGPVILPPFALCYLYIKWGEAERQKAIRKDPKLALMDE